MPVKQLAIEQIVNGDDILRAIEDREGMRFMPSLRGVGVVLRRINIDREQLPSLLRPPFMRTRNAEAPFCRDGRKEFGCARQDL